MSYEITGVGVLAAGILVWFLGTWILNRVQLFKRLNIPAAVIGGLICSVVVAIIYYTIDLQVSFDMRLRDACLMIFFSTIGLSAKLNTLKAGGKALLILMVLCAVFLVLQDVTGVLLAKLFGAHPAYGLFGGSISFAGGHGTAIAWGKEADAAGLVNASELGIACATFGLIAGGIIGGPLAERLIKKHQISTTRSDTSEDQISSQGKSSATVSQTLSALLAIAICLGAGDAVNKFLFSREIMLPGFLTAMIVGIIITNTRPSGGILALGEAEVNRFGEICLQLFLSMSLMSLQLWTLMGNMSTLLIILSLQVLVITLFTVFLVFRAMGKDYHAAVISAGFCGLGLGATPVGIANMQAVTEKYGPSPKAFLVIPLLGSFFIDITNALVIKMFVASPWLQVPLP